MKPTKYLIPLLMLDALAVFVMQVARWPGAWVFVAFYWLVLTIKNYIDWKRTR